MSLQLRNKINASIAPSENQKVAFPDDIFPQSLRDFANAANYNMGFPIDYLYAGILSAAGLAIGNTHKLQVKSTWTEAPLLYMAIVGMAGQYKTHSVKLAYAPIKEWDARQYTIYEAEMKEYKRALHAFKAIQTKVQDVEEPVKPTPRRRIVSDHTIEALYGVLKDNPAIAIFMDELKGWFGNFARYNKGSETEFWLSVFSGGDINVIRKTSDPIFIKSPYLAVIGGIQTDILQELGKDGRDKSGFTDRILFAYPDTLPMDQWRDTDIHPSLLYEYSNIINRLLQVPENYDNDGNAVPTHLFMCEAAKEQWAEWYNRNAALKHTAQDNRISGIYTKLESYTLRFALILQMLRYATNEGDNRQVTAQSMEGAIKLTEYFRATALKALDAMLVSDPVGTKGDKFQAVFQQLPQQFKTAELKALCISVGGISFKTFQRELGNKSLFKYISHGLYEKVA